MAEATDSMDRLHTLVERFYEEMSIRVRALEVLDIQHRGNADLTSADDTEPIATIRGHPPDVSYEATIDRQTVHFDFLDDLQMSRVYRRNQAFRKSGMSLVTNSAYSLGWSFFSNLSMAEVSNISVINLAIVEGEIFNPGRSSQKWSAQRNKGDFADGHVDRQRTLPYKVAREPVKPDISAAIGRECRSASSQTQQQSLPPDASSTALSEPLMEVDDDGYPCNGCGEV